MLIILAGSLIIWKNATWNAWYMIETRLSSIESQPKKVVVVVVVVFVVIIVGHKNLTLKFGQNLVNNKWYIVLVIVLVLLLLFQNWSDSGHW